MENLKELIKRAQEGNEEAKEALNFIDAFAKGVDEAVKNIV